MRCFYSALNRLGPSITPYTRKLDDFARIEDASIISTLNCFRGPFSTVSEYLSVGLKPNYVLSLRILRLHVLNSGGNHERLKSTRETERCLQNLSWRHNIYEGVTPNHRFSLKLDDFRLSSIMVSMTINSSDFETKFAACLARRRI